MDDIRAQRIHLMIILNEYFLRRFRESLARGEDPNHVLMGGYTPFIRAISDIPYDNIEIFEEYINAGADVNRCTHLGSTPLHFAVYLRKEQLVDLLIRSGADVNAKDFVGKLALHYAVSRWGFDRLPIPIFRERNIISKLLKLEGIDLNAVDFFGNTPLFWAVNDQQTNAALMLLRHQANPNICNKESKTPLHVAFAGQPSWTEVQLLINGASIYCLDANGQTPLDILIQNFGVDNRPIERINLILKIIAFKYDVTKDLMRNLEGIPHVIELVNRCCKEVFYMRRDFISNNVTVHDFILNCYNENQFENILFQIDQPVIERLITDVYPEYSCDILKAMPKSRLKEILEITAKSRLNTKDNAPSIDVLYLFSSLDRIFLVSEHLDHDDVFSLIVAFSNVRIAESLQNLRNRRPSILSAFN